MRQVDDDSTQTELSLERLDREFTEGGTLTQCAVTLNIDEDARVSSSNSEHGPLRVGSHGSLHRHGRPKPDSSLPMAVHPLHSS